MVTPQQQPPQQAPPLDPNAPPPTYPGAPPPYVPGPITQPQGGGAPIGFVVDGQQPGAGYPVQPVQQQVCTV